MIVHTSNIDRRSIRTRRGAFVCLLLLLFTMANSFSAAADTDDRMPSVLPYYDDLVMTARAEGKVRVIVGLNASFRPEGAIPDVATTKRQRDGIAAAQQALLHRLRDHNPRLVQSYSYIPFIALDVDAAALKVLVSDPDVRSLHADEKQQAALFDNIAFIGGDAEHTFGGFTGAGQSIAILDSGVDGTFAFLQGKVVAEACYSTPNLGNGERSLCPNGETSQVGEGAAKPSCSFLVCDHGTHVAGIVAGNQMTVDFTGFGQQYLSGVAKGATIIAIQVFERDSGDKISTYPTDQIKALERVYELREEFKIAAVNMSLGGGYYTSQAECDQLNPSIKAAIDLLRSVGIATIVASGNAAYAAATSSPACISSAIGVGSVAYNSYNFAGAWIAPSSNRAPWVSLYAPGVSIVSTGFGAQAGGDVATEGWTVKSGTSQAAPHIAGAWAVLREKAPDATIEEILAALQTTGIDVPDVGTTYLKKRVQVAAAVEQVGRTGCSQCTERLWVPLVVR